MLGIFGKLFVNTFIDVRFMFEEADDEIPLKAHLNKKNFNDSHIISSPNIKIFLLMIIKAIGERKFSSGMNLNMQQGFKLLVRRTNLN